MKPEDNKEKWPRSILDLTTFIGITYAVKRLSDKNFLEFTNYLTKNIFFIKDNLKTSFGNLTEQHSSSSDDESNNKSSGGDDFFSEFKNSESFISPQIPNDTNAAELYLKSELKSNSNYNLSPFDSNDSTSVDIEIGVLGTAVYLIWTLLPSLKKDYKNSIQPKLDSLGKKIFKFLKNFNIKKS